MGACLSEWNRYSARRPAPPTPFGVVEPSGPFHRMLLGKLVKSGTAGRFAFANAWRSEIAGMLLLND
jgi:hypothetical protein